VPRFARTAIAVAIVGGILLVASRFSWNCGEDPQRRGREGKEPAVAPSPAATTTSAPARPPTHATQVSAEERRQLADRIAAAHAARGYQAPTPAPSLPEQGSGSNDLERLTPHVLDALKEAIPFLAACYEQNAPKATRSALAQMTLTGDPDIGTIIDADEIVDEQHQPLPKKLDECLRNTMMTLELPPIAEGDKVKIQYSFRLDDK
jgi:hypothetical protein